MYTSEVGLGDINIVLLLSLIYAWFLFLLVSKVFLFTNVLELSLLIIRKAAVFGANPGSCRL